MGWDIRDVTREKRYDPLNIQSMGDFKRTNSLSEDWPPGYNVIMNPPFGTRSNDLSTLFLKKAVEHSDKNNVWSIALMLTSCLQAAKRLCIPMPEFRIDLTWRPRFESPKSMGSGYFKDFSWFVYAPKKARTTIDQCRVGLSVNRDSSMTFRVTREPNEVQRGRA